MELAVEICRRVASIPADIDVLHLCRYAILSQGLTAPDLSPEVPPLLADSDENILHVVACDSPFDNGL